MSLITNAIHVKTGNNLPSHVIDLTTQGHLAMSKDGVAVSEVRDQSIVIKSPTSSWQEEEGTLISQLVLSKYLPTIFKVNKAAPMFVKTGAQTISIGAGNRVLHKGKVFTYAVDTAISIVGGFSALGKDFSIFVRDDGSLYAIQDMKNSPYVSVLGDTLIGGFHYGAVPTDATVVSGSFATTGSGHIWSQSDVDNLKGINKFSIWDLEYRPKCDPRGMTCVAGQFWVDIYFCGTQHITNGTSVYGSDVASGTVFPVKPLEFGGNGTAKYSRLSVFEALEINMSHGKRLGVYEEFCCAVYGTTEGQSLGGSSVTVPKTTRQAGYTSLPGLEQASGHMWVIGGPITTLGSPSDWTVNAGRGSIYGTTGLGLFTGSRDTASHSGSTSSRWNETLPSGLNWGMAMRGFSDFK